MAPLHGQTGSCSAAGAIEDVKLRQRLFEVFSGSKKRAHSDLYRAQKHMRQPRAGGALGSDQDVATSENDICLEEINQMSRHVATFA
jgi:triphosphoribosyl-dephospho-CoA synthetase